MTGEDLDRHGAAAILRKESDPVIPKVLRKLVRNRFAARKVRSGRNHCPGFTAPTNALSPEGPCRGAPLIKDVAREFMRDIFHQPVLGMKARVGHKENPRRTCAKLDNQGPCRRPRSAGTSPGGYRICRRVSGPSGIQSPER